MKTHDKKEFTSEGSKHHNYIRRNASQFSSYISEEFNVLIPS